MNSRTIDGVWYPGTEYVENVVTLSVPVVFPNYDVLEPDFQYWAANKGEDYSLLRWLDQNRISV